MRFLYAITLLLFAVGFGLQEGFAQTPERVLDEVTESLVDGDPDKLSRHFGERVEVTVLGKRQLLSKTQATYVIRDFFTNYPPDSFNTLHKGTTSGTLYALGVLRSEKGEFEVNIFIQVSDVKINEIRFERSNSASRQ
ncbi:MAG: DUF4783 domain-containing protein [Bacteroidia bacterium]|nr:DUF4783 domain-containing protein [Bacteroidia bacterium]